MAQSTTIDTRGIIMELSKIDLQRIKEIKELAAELYSYQDTEIIIKACNEVLNRKRD